MGGEFDLPEHIIQHIQSFLTRKEAARTTVLSTSWCGAWLTRSSLEFVQSDFALRWPFRSITIFSEFADKTLKRYEDSNRTIECFSICSNDEFHSELIARALKIGATRLSIQLLNCPNDDVLPDEVLFGSENLVDLTVKGCQINLRKQVAVVRCSRLQSLCLRSVRIPNPSSIARIISSCPLIESLSLSNIHKVRGENNNEDDVAIDIVLPRLSSLVVTNVYFDVWFLSDVSTTFPSLKDLTLSLYSYVRKNIKDMLISSPSLERLVFSLWFRSEYPSVAFDIPNIRKFNYHGLPFPSVLSFRSTTSRECESHAYISHESSSYFSGLTDLLTMLSPSRIYLSLSGYGSSFHYILGNFTFSPAVEIENLTIDFGNLSEPSCYGLLDALFRMCRPKLITISTSCFRQKKQNIDLLRDTILSKGLNNADPPLTPYRYMYGLNDLKEAKAQVFDEDVFTWRDVSLDALSSDDNRKVRFHLNWEGNHTSVKHSSSLIRRFSNMIAKTLSLDSLTFLFPSPKI